MDASPPDDWSPVPGAPAAARSLPASDEQVNADADGTKGFVRAFRAFLDEVVAKERTTAEDHGPQIGEVVREHLGSAATVTPLVVREEIPGHALVDLDIALEVLAERGGGERVVGVGGGDQAHHQSFGDLLTRGYGFYGTGPVDHVNLPTGPDTTRRVIAFGVRLLTFRGQPLAVLQRAARPQYGRDSALEVACLDEDLAPAFIDEVRRLMLERSVLRGQVVSFSGSPFEPHSNGGITFVARPDVGEADVVLPPGALERIRRHVIGIGRQREQLVAAGQHLKRGVLLYGPPGTGKTHTVRHLVASAPGTTVVLLSGASLAYVTTAAQLARATQPAVVVLEDCDLVAEDRGMSPGERPLLFQLLDAMDGLDGDADVTFLLTTNRADLLERALAERPGRVDLAVEVPLPDLEARRQLLRLYARDLPLSDAALDDAAARSAGVTASFTKELLRRAVLVAATDGRPVQDADLAEALDELLSDAEQLTRSLLGSGGPGTPDEGPSPGADH
ncbi:AAA family ATPase [Cellulomonas marina]|uniref:ATPase family associated with various cellular activities (AAA) n=1 Tax=Cellulomonas marina TaxID=988821 RepID=A0A1I0Z3S2_9CELL|nr:ATP-binding protein [Cellulomonas marina]GIG28225.1 ATPase [Cellulomonas marina]SFB20211.1 ATPase family associated with various cellular activities (AAA) [Cellulomonas marina]